MPCAQNSGGGPPGPGGKISEHVDAMWRRMLLERNYEWDDHIEHSYRIEEESHRAWRLTHTPTPRA